MTSDNTIDDGSIEYTDPDPSPLTDKGIDHEGVRLLLDTPGKDVDSERLAETLRRCHPDAFETLTEGERESAKVAMRGVETASKTTTRATVGDPTRTEWTRFQQAVGNPRGKS